MENLGLIEKIQQLPPDTISEIEDFVDFLREKKLRQGNNKAPGSDLLSLGISLEAAAEQRSALSTFAEDWEHSGMEVYDEL